MGGPKWGHSTDPDKRPETALLSIRKDLGLYANLRPAALRPALADACPLKKETAEKGIDLMMVRELTGGIYFGRKERYQTEDRGEEAADRMAYSEQEIERIGRRAFELARLPPGKGCPAWTRPTCWRPAACGAPSCTAWRRSTAT